MTSPTHNAFRRFTHSYEASTASINSARTDLDQWLAENDIDDLRPSAELVISELASNAVEWAETDDYSVDAAVDDHELVLVVSNRSSRVVPSRQDWGPSDVLAARGRGLTIVDALCDHVAVEQGDGLVTITARLHRTE